MKKRGILYFFIFTLLSLSANAQRVLHITQDIDLSKNKSFTLSDNAVLFFEGGRIINGTLKGKNTAISAPAYPIFQNVKLEGSWNVPIAYFEWFGAIGDGKTDDRQSIQEALDSPFRFFILPTKNYLIASTAGDNLGITISHPTHIQGSAQYDFDGGTMISAASKSTFKTMLLIKSQGVELENIIFTGNNSHVENIISTQDDDEYYTRLTLRKVAARNCNNTCIDLRTFGSRLEQVTAGYCKTGFYIHGNERKGETYTSNILEGCVCFSAREYGYKISLMNYCVMNNCAGDRNGFSNEEHSYSGYPYYFYGCSNITMNSCGCESSYNTINLDCCKGFVINALTDWSDKDKSINGYNTNRQIYVKNTQNTTFSNSTIGSHINNQPYICLEKSSGISFSHCMPRLNGGSVENRMIQAKDCQIDTNSAVSF